jgi:hypothetical protein
MIFTADQIVAHLIGDYIFQSHWMATEKTKNSVAAAVHAITYSIPFLFITQSPEALAIICGTHFLVDRFRIARYVVWLKNGPFSIELGKEVNYLNVKPVTGTGYPEDVPAWLSVWLLIIADNTIHIFINGLAVWYFGGAA